MTAAHARLLLLAGGLVSLLLLLASPAAPARAAKAACRGRTLMGTTLSPSAMRKATLCLINRRRAARRLRPLRSNGALVAAATGFSRRMVAESFFAHVSPDGTALPQRVREAGYLRGAAGWRAGENLAFGEQFKSSPAAIVRAWMNSTGHRTTMLDPGFRDIGIGIAAGSPGARFSGITVTADFGQRTLAPRRR